MYKHDTNEERRKEGDVSKGLPEAVPDVHNPYEEDDLPVENEHHRGKAGEKPPAK